MSQTVSILSDLFLRWSGEEPRSIVKLAASGSDRSYYRITGSETDALGTWNDDLRENEAFIHFTEHFNHLQLPVPTVYAVDKTRKAYLQTDLGDTTLFQLLVSEGLTPRVKDLYRQATHWLVQFQMKGAVNLDTSHCYPRSAFDRQSMMWDLNYFKYYFARLSGAVFDEQALEDDFNRLINHLSEAQSGFFLYRDFQSRNIMIAGNRTYFIDYQGGRTGALHYDVASLLFDAKANLPQPFRDELLELYLNEAGSYPLFNRDEFVLQFPSFVLIRILQALGAYGFRGYYQKKSHFLQSIPFAMKNLEYLFKANPPQVELHTLRQLLMQFIEKFADPKPETHLGLKVNICSFSFKDGIPEDTSGNGGGFVFDCRALPNPGRLDEYKNLTGLDTAVIRYMQSFPDTGLYMKNVFSMVDQAVENYQSRNFTNLMVCFGCTGGQHRSVFMAENLSRHLNEKYSLLCKAEHLRRQLWP